jgi:hypothetical protein
MSDAPSRLQVECFRAYAHRMEAADPIRRYVGVELAGRPSSPTYTTFRQAYGT